MPFELRPEGAPSIDPAYIDRGWAQRIEPLSREMGVEMKKPTVFPKTRLAHEAAAFATTAGKGPEMAVALLAAYFQQGRDIGQVAVLAQIGAEVGLDPKALQHSLEVRAHQGEVAQGLQLAGRYGITAVPSFIVGQRFLVQGLPSEEHLLRAIRMCRGEDLVNPE